MDRSSWTKLQWAQEYAARGWKIFPVHGVVRGEDGAVAGCTCDKGGGCTDAGKHPRVFRWQKDASSDPEVVRGWFSPEGMYGGACNIGLVCGAASGVTVLDVDVGPGKDGAKTWAELTREAGEPDTLIARTGSGGLHAFFRYNSALKTSAGTLGAGVDCRNDRGYVVLAPSDHRSGGRYEWMDGRWIGDDGCVLADLPAHLSVRKERRGRPKKNGGAGKYSLSAVKGMLECIPADDRDLWRAVGIILGREFARSDEAWALYVEWSGRWKGTEGRNHEKIMREAFYELSGVEEEGGLSIGTIVAEAGKNGWNPKPGQVPKEDYLFFMPDGSYIYRPTREFCAEKGVAVACGTYNDGGDVRPAVEWIQQNAMVTSVTRHPDIEEVVKGLNYDGGELVKSTGGAVYNTYRHPEWEPGDARLAAPWIEHVHKVFPRTGDADQFMNYMAHRVQKPGEKPRFALLIAGEQGVGKDTAIAMALLGIGKTNVANIDPSAFEMPYNEFCASTLVLISEAANVHEMNKWAFNERTKNLIAGQPDWVSVNPKYGRKYAVQMFCGVIVTTNHMLTGVYIPPDDRRYDVIEAATRVEMGFARKIGDGHGANGGGGAAVPEIWQFDPEARNAYFEKLYGWFDEEDGARHVATFLASRDISGWSAANGQRRTRAHNAVVSSGFEGDAEFLDALEKIGAPAFTGARLWQEIERAPGNEISRHEFHKRLPHVMSRIGMAKLNNPDAKDGRWKKDGAWFSIYFDPSRCEAARAPTIAFGVETKF